MKLPSLHPLFGPAFTSCPPFQWYLQSKESLIKSQYEMLKLSAVNAQGSRVIIVVVQVGAVKIYVVWQQQWRRSGKRREGDETQFTTKIGGKTSLGLSYFIHFVEFSFPVRYVCVFGSRTIGSNKLQKYSTILKYFYFPL
jgi:hypothetical protein